jgi:VWFA-related protein
MRAWRICIAACAVTLLPAAQTDVAETSTHDAPVAFQSKVTLVPIPVVVRDRKSKAVGTLAKDDFEIYDNGKLQVISRFSIQKADAAAFAKPVPVEPADGTRESLSPGQTTLVIPTRFVAYVFDDLHFNIEDMTQVRQAVLKHFDGIDTQSGRAAVFTTSGIDQEDFTSDRAKLESALNRLKSRTRASNPETGCPYIPYYVADLIVNRNDPIALKAVLSAAKRCPGGSMTPGALAARELNVGESETRGAIEALQNRVKRIAAMPGQRTLVLVSPGFIAPFDQDKISQLMDLALRLNVVINAIDGRGVFVDSRYDGNTQRDSGAAMAQYQLEAGIAGGETLSALAAGTGGTIFAGNNDLAEGFRRTSSQPEFTYLLGFSPQNLKNDGSLHSIQVKLKQSAGLTVQARRGYFAPRRSPAPEDKEEQDLQDALFTRAERTDFPLAFNTQFFKSSETAAKISIVARVGLEKLHFRKAEGRNEDDVVVVTGLFDRDGNLLNARKNVANLRFRDETFEKRVGAGLALRASFEDVKPGVYMLRLVARDTEGQMISAANGAIEIP